MYIHGRDSRHRNPGHRGLHLKTQESLVNFARTLPTPVPEPPVHALGRTPKPVGHRVAVPAGSTSVDVAVTPAGASGPMKRL
jgi:hypothetical protein